MLVYIEDIWKDTQDTGMSNDLWGWVRRVGRLGRKLTFLVYKPFCAYIQKTLHVKQILHWLPFEHIPPGQRNAAMDSNLNFSGENVLEAL